MKVANIYWCLNQVLLQVFYFHLNNLMVTKTIEVDYTNIYILQIKPL